ncbi:uncharacterized protein LOC131932459 [Physella acuta]|uniref:uncharacterized protein LOC131932459 n=1 Tax=Physella acuta TaxID=109671 RepID=UPI0027DB0BDF|nr:uncharacterized protein LOC131932459 [Physella acuta]
MINSCCVVNCKNSQHNNKSCQYFTVPVLRKHEGPKAKAISKQRIQQLLKIINRKDFTEKSIKSKESLTVCTYHLVSGKLCPKLEGDEVRNCTVSEHVCNKAINRLLPVPADQSCGTLQTEVTAIENQALADNILDNVEMECTISSQNNDELNYDTFRKDEHEHSNNSPSPNESFLLRSIDDLTTQCSAPAEQPYPVRYYTRNCFTFF